MSAFARKWLARQRVHDGTLMLVLGVLADASDPAGQASIPQLKIAQKAGLQERAVRTAVAVLERAGILTRRTRSDGGRKGRKPDLVTLAIEREFDLDKEAVKMLRATSPDSQKKGGATSIVTGTECRKQKVGQGVGQPARESVAPSASRVGVYINTLSADTNVRTSGRCWSEKRGRRWRARVRVDGVDLNLGRFPSEAGARGALERALADIDHVIKHPTAGPREPVEAPTGLDLASINPALPDTFTSSWRDQYTIREPISSTGGRPSSRPASEGSLGPGQTQDETSKAAHDDADEATAASSYKAQSKGW